uniref:methionyl-tRNA formyltransferase n=1 Tax=Dietzia sp. TaxID=1871616 RepID=UPI002FD994F0
MRIVFTGTPETAVPSLRAILDSGRHEVAAVITRPDAPKGRGRTLHRSPVGEVADAAGLRVLTPASARDPEFAAQLRELDVEAAAVVAYGNILPQEVLDIPRFGWVNLHFSLLPAWRGASPVNAAIAAGDEITGASTFRLEAGMDTGPVYGTITTEIEP